ncbi:MAG: exodeoxyribonuclease III [Cardiobacteriaceae bacterium]|nr:exodeoxyribonuclease III [Cardiobacteriaceae bacterium]
MAWTLASWNVNSFKIRETQVLNYLRERPIAVLGLQELKQETHAVNQSALHDLGYHTAVFGQKTYNGVALISQFPLHDIQYNLPNFEDPQSRLIAATIQEVRVINVYVPNGKEVGDPKYEYKLQFLSALQDYVREQLQQYPKLIIMGDFNIAPEDIDVFDPKAWRDKILCSAPERKALSDLLSLGLVDSFRHLNPDKSQFSWWDYRFGGFEKNRGMRIDLILASKALCLENKLEKAEIDPKPRTHERPSDHTPVLLTLT